MNQNYNNLNSGVLDVSAASFWDSNIEKPLFDIMNKLYNLDEIGYQTIQKIINKAPELLIDDDLDGVLEEIKPLRDVFSSPDYMISPQMKRADEKLKKHIGDLLENFSNFEIIVRMTEPAAKAEPKSGKDRLGYEPPEPDSGKEGFNKPFYSIEKPESFKRLPNQ